MYMRYWLASYGILVVLVNKVYSWFGYNDPLSNPDLSQSSMIRAASRSVLTTAMRRTAFAARSEPCYVWAHGHTRRIEYKEWMIALTLSSHVGERGKVVRIPRRWLADDEVRHRF